GADARAVRRRRPARSRDRGRHGRRRLPVREGPQRRPRPLAPPRLRCATRPLVDNVSSSHIRSLLRAGEVGTAAKLLGRPAEVEGIVVHGDQRGRLLGFPTANLQTPPGVLVPQLGIYAGATLDYRAAISIGTNPTYGGTERRAEAHLLDFDADLYGQRLVVELWERLRDEVRFGSESELVEAIGADCARARVSVRPA